MGSYKSKLRELQLNNLVNFLKKCTYKHYLYTNIILPL